MVNGSSAWSKLIPETSKHQAILRASASAGAAIIIATAVWTRLEPISVGSLKTSLRPAIYACFFLAAGTFVRSFLADRSSLVSVRARTLPAWSYVPFGLVACLLLAIGAADRSQYCSSDDVARLLQLPFLDRLRTLFLPSGYMPTGLDVAFRPLKHALILSACGANALSLVVVGGHAAVSILITALLVRWGTSATVATIIGAGFMAHPVPLLSLQDATQLYYVYGALFFLSALVSLRHAITGGRGWTLAASMFYALSMFFSETWLGGIVLLLLVLGRESTTHGPRAPGRTAWDPRIVRIGLVLLAAWLMVALILSYANVAYAPPGRLGKVANVFAWKRALLNLMFDPYLAFFVPVEPARFEAIQQLKPILLTAGIVSAGVPIVAAACWERVSWLAAASWLGAGASLGPAVMFFEMTPDWSQGRISYGPSAVLAVFTGLIIGGVGGRRHGKRWAAITAASWVSITLCRWWIGFAFSPL